MKICLATVSMVTQMRTRTCDFSDAEFKTTSHKGLIDILVIVTSFFHEDKLHDHIHLL